MDWLIYELKALLATLAFGAIGLGLFALFVYVIAEMAKALAAVFGAY